MDIMKIDESYKQEEQNNICWLRRRNNKKLVVRKEQKRRHTGTTTHASNTDMESGINSVERGARQATLDSWVARPMKHVDKWKPD
eukprot:1840439-Heterocapsa_arctica.AAC.2